MESTHCDGRWVFQHDVCPQACLGWQEIKRLQLQFNYVQESWEQGINFTRSNDYPFLVLLHCEFNGIFEFKFERSPLQVGTGN